MDEIQKVLIKAGRKDLAQKYYEKVAVETDDDNYDNMIEEMLNAVWQVAELHKYDTTKVAGAPVSVTHALEKIFPK